MQAMVSSVLTSKDNFSKKLLRTKGSEIHLRFDCVRACVFVYECVDS